MYSAYLFDLDGTIYLGDSLPDQAICRLILSAEFGE